MKIHITLLKGKDLQTNCFAMCFILALKKIFIYLYSVCSYHFVCLDLDPKSYDCLSTTIAHNSFLKAKLTSETQTPSIH